MPFRTGWITKNTVSVFDYNRQRFDILSNHWLSVFQISLGKPVASREQVEKSHAPAAKDSSLGSGFGLTRKRFHDRFSDSIALGSACEVFSDHIFSYVLL